MTILVRDFKLALRVTHKKNEDDRNWSTSLNRLGAGIWKNQRRLCCSIMPGCFSTPALSRRRNDAASVGSLNYSVSAPPPTPEPASIMSLVMDSGDGVAVSPPVSLSPSPQPMARQQPSNITLNQLNFDIPTISESCLVLGVLRAVSESFTNALRGNCSDLRRNARRSTNNPQKFENWRRLDDLFCRIQDLFPYKPGQTA